MARGPVSVDARRPSRALAVGVALAAALSSPPKPVDRARCLLGPRVEPATFRNEPGAGRRAVPAPLMRSTSARGRTPPVAGGSTRLRFRPDPLRVAGTPPNGGAPTATTASGCGRPG
jgi:hypothetical protein